MPVPPPRRAPAWPEGVHGHAGALETAPAALWRGMLIPNAELEEWVAACWPRLWLPWRRALCQGHVPQSSCSC